MDMPSLVRHGHAAGGLRTGCGAGAPQKEEAMNGKITVFGAGNVGGAVTRRLIERKLRKKVVLVDKMPGKAEGIALDILEASPIDLLEPACAGHDFYGRST